MLLSTMQKPLKTNTMEQIPSLKANSCSASQKFPMFYGAGTFFYTHAVTLNNRSLFELTTAFLHLI
jgi:hypothetical protein